MSAIDRIAELERRHGVGYFGHINCGILAMHLVTGRPATLLAEDYLSWAVTSARRAPIPGGDNVDNESFADWLRSLGWTMLCPDADGVLPALPSTCIVFVPGHAIGIVGGIIYDAARWNLWNCRILFALAPPYEVGLRIPAERLPAYAVLHSEISRAFEGTELIAFDRDLAIAGALRELWPVRERRRLAIESVGSR